MSDVNGAKNKRSYDSNSMIQNKKTRECEPNIQSRILLNGTNGAELVETSFHKHADLINTVIAQAEPAFEIEPKIIVYGKERRQPRDVQFRSDVSKGYFYSNQVMESQPFTDAMRQLINIVNSQFGADYNGILINRYKDGTKTVGAHADSETGLNQHAGVVGITHGATRNFRIRDSKTKKIIGNYPARHLMALQMKGPFQQYYTHEIPQEKKIFAPRISLTFRQHNPVTEARLFEKISAKRHRNESAAD